MLELRLLNYFLVLSEELHYTKAAERLHISQPTLSNQIKILESIMGTKLFKYAGKKTLLTEEGKILQEHAYKIFFDIEQTKADIKNFSGKSRTQVSIGSSGSHLILVPCSNFNKFHNNILISMEEHSSKTIFESVKNGRLDIGVIYSTVDDPSIHSEVLALETYLAVVPLSSRLAESDSVQLEDLVNENIILIGDSSSSRKNIDKAFSYINHTCNPIIQAPNLNSCIALLKDSDNITILPNSYLKSIDTADFKTMPISDYPPRQTITLIYRKDLFIDPVLKDLLDEIKTFHK